MTAEERLRGAAESIGQMNEAEVRRKLAQLRAARDARSEHEISRQQAELDSLELDQAAYQLARRAQADNRLPEAARWYHAAAVNDYSDAQLQLALVLDALSAEAGARSEGPAVSREQAGLISDAAQWYAAAYAAGETEAAEFLDTLIARHDLRHQRAGQVPVTAAPAPGPGADGPRASVLPASVPDQPSEQRVGGGRV